MKILPGQSEGTGAFTACSEASFLTSFDIFYYVFHTWVSLCFFHFLGYPFLLSPSLCFICSSALSFTHSVFLTIVTFEMRRWISEGTHQSLHIFREKE